MQRIALRIADFERDLKYHRGQLPAGVVVQFERFIAGQKALFASQALRLRLMGEKVGA